MPMRDEISGLKRQQILLYAMLIGLVTVTIWIGYGLASSQRTDQVDRELRELAEPLNPNLDENVINELESKRNLTETDLNDFAVYIYTEDEEGNRRKVILGEEPVVLPPLEPQASPDVAPAQDDEPLTPLTATRSSTVAPEGDDDGELL